MNETFSKQTDVQGRVLYNSVSDNPISTGVRSTLSTTVADWSSDLPANRSTGAQGRWGFGTQQSSPSNHASNGHQKRESSWHKFVRRYPNTIGLACIIFPLAGLAQILMMLHP